MPICRVCGRELSESVRVEYQGERYKSCPNCSNGNGEQHVFYRDPEDFGTTMHRVTRNNPDGIQSWCASCRGRGYTSQGILCSEIHGE